MERITKRIGKTHACYAICEKECPDGIYNDNPACMCTASKMAMKRLLEYEDTGLTPPEIMELKERGTAKAVQKVDEQPYFRKHFHDYVCPVCHKKIELRWKFCGHCGQRLKKENDDAENT